MRNVLGAHATLTSRAIALGPRQLDDAQLSRRAIAVGARNAVDGAAGACVTDFARRRQGWPPTGSRRLLVEVLLAECHGAYEGDAVGRADRPAPSLTETAWSRWWVQ